MDVRIRFSYAIFGIVAASLAGCGHGNPAAPNFTGLASLRSAQNAPAQVVNGFEMVPLPQQIAQGPVAIAGGTDGNVWFTDRGDELAGFVEPSSRAFQTFSVPSGGRLIQTSAQPMQPHPNFAGGIDFGISYGFGSATASSGVTVYDTMSVPGGMGQTGAVQCCGDIAPMPDGSLFFEDQDPQSEQHVLWHAQPDSRPAREIPAPNKKFYIDAATLAQDGNVYFADFGNERVGRYNVTTHGIDEDDLKLPVGYQGVEGELLYLGPGGFLYACGYSNPNLIGTTLWMKFKPPSKTITTLAQGLSSDCPQIADAGMVGADGAFWFAPGNEILARIDGSTNQYSTYDPAAGGVKGKLSITSIAPGSDGNVWISILSNALTVFHMQTISTAPTSASLTIHQSENVVITEKNYTNGFRPYQSDNCRTIVGVAQLSKNTYDLEGLRAGRCNVSFYDFNNMAQVTVPVAVR